LLYGSVYKFEPRWKRIEEKLDLHDVWCMKNSQDYLHHMKFEQEIFNLIAGPALVDLFSVFLHKPKQGTENLGGLSLLLYMGCRACVMVGFVFYLSHKMENKVGWFLFCLLSFGLYVAGTVTMSKESGSQDMFSIRKVILWNESISIALLYVYNLYIYFYMKDYKQKTKKAAVKLM